MESSKSNDNSIGSAAELSESESTAEFIRHLSEASNAKSNKSERIVESMEFVSSQSATEDESSEGATKESESKKKVSEKVKSETHLETDESKFVESDGHEEGFSNDERHNWWKESVTKYAFNLPTVRAILGRLVGTDEMELNDHQFMMNLRTSVWGDFDEKLNNRIAQRRATEDERCKRLILKSKFNLHNCMKKMLPMHSAVLAFDLPSEQMIKLEKPLNAGRLKHNDDDGPVFNINRKTNITVHLRRKTLKSIRKTNFEFLMRQVLKDSQLSEYSESRAIQEKIKIIRDGISEKKKSKSFAFFAKMVMKVRSMMRSKNVPDKSITIGSY